jgi:hypothetical protein
MIKALMKLAIEGMYLNIMNTVYDKPIVNIILNGEKLKRQYINQRYVLSPPLFNIVLKFLVRAIHQKKKYKIYKLERK